MPTNGTGLTWEPSKIRDSRKREPRSRTHFTISKARPDRKAHQQRTLGKVIRKSCTWDPQLLEIQRRNTVKQKKVRYCVFGVHEQPAEKMDGGSPFVFSILNAIFYGAWALLQKFSDNHTTPRKVLLCSVSISALFAVGRWMTSTTTSLCLEAYTILDKKAYSKKGSRCKRQNDVDFVALIQILQIA